MKTKKKVFVAGAMTFAMLGTMIPQNWNVSAASNLISNGDFENIKSADIGKYTGNASDMKVGSWYSNSGGEVSYIGYNESERSGILPANNNNVWIRQVVNVEKNTDYVFSTYVKTSLSEGEAIVQVLDGNGTAIEGIKETNMKGVEWTQKKISFNSGNHSKITVSVLKWVDESNTDSDIYKASVYVDEAVLMPKVEYTDYEASEESKTKLVNFIKNSDLINLQDDDIQKNDGNIQNYVPGKFYYNGDTPATIGEGYGENANGLVLPENVKENSLKVAAHDLKAQTDYVFKVYIKHGASGTGTVTNINGIDGTDTKLFVADDNAGYASGQEWKEYTYTFNTKDCTKLYIDIYKYVGESSVSISDLRLYEKSQYNQYEEEEKEEAAEEENKKYTEVWRDDFDTLDTSTWSYQLGHKRGIEPQDYVSNKDNVFVEDGKLYLRATEKDEYRVHYNADGSDIVKKYDSGSIATFGKKEFLYGKIEMRAKLPKGAGAFPAFWTLGNDFTLDGLVDSKQGVGWPMCGEIDIMELIGANPDVSGTSDSTVHGTIHNGLTENGDKAQTNTYSLKEGTFNDDYHTFGIVWNPDTIEWYVDGNVYSTIYITDLDYFQKPHYLLFNLAAGGAWPGFPNEDTDFPMDFIIDYVSYSQTAAQKEAADKYYATAPTFSGVKDITISDESQLSSLLDNVKATDANGKALDVSCSINDGQKLMWNGRTRTSEIDFSKEGTYEIVYSTIGENNVYTRACATLHVK
ncbi:glycoside hydrolase family 16 protein [Massilimicrobiota timonensis]|uniref:Glycoside hydrolase family 16 protein n=1 Tax=Massilimicrobiota timonensis TaxID=1776392 RepID=A0ABT7UG08_9FIRM|nr:glycoside hydrolase family 16 protein [Massilimicrobiota timonensis]MDM8195085.1 glycoside hydrolase family 16 protein [Massilimicrobiota timonensis]